MSGSEKGGKRKSIIVTGGASGIGLSMVRHFLSQGHSVAVLDIISGQQSVVAQKLSAEYPGGSAKVSFHQCDVSSWEEQAAVFRRVYELHGGLDVCMANAGISEGATSSLITLEESSGSGGETGGTGGAGECSKPKLKVVDVNFVGVIYTVKLAIHYMNQKPKTPTGSGSGSRGSIICTASNAGIYPFATAPLYAATKAGVIGLVRSTARNLESVNIQINALAPAVLDTNIAPDKKLFKHMIVTPMSTLIAGVEKFLGDPSLSGEVAEIHGDSVSLRASPEWVDEDSRKNVEMFWTLGYA
ncbi:hypothetical protein QBC46DRAFT_454232 [Diplogelasinospora grovesii]|uniref:Uncharacterized protein n=1 Tax=Diplogelasinospora grovesii TaxID=303347 RepID=A0AAN6RYZ5_9PEZI|nr:hypothetical protein QBC46DRAFT_454232 [Diplogelasinospora grovesii]